MAGGFYFFAFVTAVSTIALTEYYALARAKGAHPHTVPGVILGVLLSCTFVYARIRDAVLSALDRAGIAVPAPTMAQYFLILFLLAIPLFLALELFRNKGSALLNLSVTLFGVVYVSLFFGCLIGIRELFIPADFPVYAHFPITGIDIPTDVAAQIYEWGGRTVVVILASLWLCDSAAYFAGRAFGRRKLFPRVSPNKTWEGAFAGFAVAVLAFLLGRSLALPYLTIGQSVICGVIIGVFGQLGDLAESLLKRDAGVKDSSTLIPGHGGVLDRFDSLMFVSPLLYFFLDFVVF